MKKRIEIPITTEAIRSLRVGEEIEIFGRVVTARDLGHRYLAERDADFLRPFLNNGMIYHCGPVMVKEARGWHAVSAGPATSMRKEPFQGRVITKYGLRGVIGKGGMGAETLASCKRNSCIYLHAVGGAAVALASTIVAVEDVFMLEEFGMAEAFWVLRVEGFPAVVTMDAHGMSLHDQVTSTSRSILTRLVS